MVAQRQESRSEPPLELLSLRKTGIAVGIVDEHSFTRECIASSLKGFGKDLDIVSFSSCNDCLQSAKNLDVILYFADQISVHNSSGSRDPASFNSLQEIAPVIIMSAVDSRTSIIEAFEKGARGYIHTPSTSPELAIQIIRFVRAGGTFVPPNGLSERRSNGEQAASRMTNARQFTRRQQAVLNHLKVGKSNKVIAYDLGISESTVKVHVRNIMKKMNATNRTEVASRAQDFTASEARLEIFDRRDDVITSL